MPSKKNNGKAGIESLNLYTADAPAHFVFKTMEQVALEHPDDEPGPHRHNYYSIIWVTRGRGTHHIDFRTYEVTPNTIHFLSPEQVHHLIMDPDHAGYVLLFTGDFVVTHGGLSEWIKKTGFFFRCDDMAPLQIPSRCNLSLLTTYIERIALEFRHKSPYYLDAIASWLNLFLLECKRIAEEISLDVEPRQQPRALIVRQYKDLLDQHFKTWHKVAEYARELHITPNYLNEVLTNETGISAKDAIMNRLMLEAKRLATHSEMTAKEVAYELGFEDPSHFSKLFKQQQEVSFSSFREEIRKKYL